MSEYRFVHTASVEEMAARIGELYAPQSIPVLRAAALLHDITKELSFTEQIALCESEGIELAPWDIKAPKTLHAMTAPAVIKKSYPEFAHPSVLSAVRWHTTGRENMSLEEKIIFISDYIDMSRTFEDCVTLRNYFWDAHPGDMSPDMRMTHLDNTLIKGFDLTLGLLVEEGSPISPYTVSARNFLIDGRE